MVYLVLLPGIYYLQGIKALASVRHGEKQSQISWLSPNKQHNYCQTCDNLNRDIKFVV